MDIYETFCEIIKETFFSESLKGEYVSLVVDEDFISTTCDKIGINEDDLLSKVRWFMYSSPRASLIENNVLCLGVIAIQLYATSLRGDTDLKGDNGYRTILGNLLSLDQESLNEWMATYQQLFWNCFYCWCEDNDFLVNKVNVRSGPWRYVRFMLSLAGCTLNKKDLQSFGYLFYIHGLQPSDMLSEKDFWQLLGGKNRVIGYTTSRSQRILRETANEATYSQIYTYYCNKWDGTYDDVYTQKRKSVAPHNPYRLFFNEDEMIFIIMDDDFQPISVIPISKLNKNQIGAYMRLNNTVIFEPSQMYPGYWESKRLIDSSDIGMALIFAPSIPRFDCHRIHIGKDYRLVKFEKSYNTIQYFTKEEKPYILEGGLKIGYHKYLHGGEPLIRINRDTKFWIDGVSNDAEDGDIFTMDIDEGKHIIKFQGYSPLRIEICRIERHEYKSPIRWMVRKKANEGNECGVFPVKCEDDSTENTFYGLNFQNLNRIEKTHPSILKNWIDVHHDVFLDTTDNLVINLLKRSK